MKRIVFTILLAVLASDIQAQRLDTLKVMHYNLLNYRNATNQCNSTTNNADKKDEALELIFHHENPDIFTVNEMGPNWLNPSKILSNALNTRGVTKYDQAEFTNNSFSGLTNMLFFNSEKLAMDGQTTLKENDQNEEYVRVIDVYHLYVKDTEALTAGDTIWIHVIVTHLKAGSTSADKTERAKMTAGIMDYLADKNLDHNYIICGDFNIQTSSEECYKNMTVTPDANVRFYDPVDAAGSWNNKSIYSNLHTQSTRVSSTSGGCFSGGGMDDRFDFILCGKEVMDNKNKVKYIEKSYRAMGNDSRRFNSTINSPRNTAVPENVAQALYDMSDHIPVILELEVGPAFANSSRLSERNLRVSTFENYWKVEARSSEINTLELLSANGSIVTHSDHISNTLLDRRELSAGMYIIRAQMKDGRVLHRKVVQN